GLRCGGRADRDRVFRASHVQRAGVGVRVHGDRPHAESLRRREDPDGDLTAIRDEERFGHASVLLVRTSKRIVAPDEARGGSMRKRIVVAVVVVIAAALASLLAMSQPASAQRLWPLIGCN